MTTDDIPARARSLAGCPFCQATAQVNDLESIGSLSRWHQVECTECGATGPKIEGCGLNYFGRDTINIYRQEAIAAWNTRAAGGEEEHPLAKMVRMDEELGLYDDEAITPAPSSSGSGEGATVEECSIVDQAPPAAFAVPNVDDKKTAHAVLLALNPSHPDPLKAAQIIASYRAALRSPAVERDVLADAVHRGRFPADREPTPFADEDRRGREYCYRIADVILALPAPPQGSGS